MSLSIKERLARLPKEERQRRIALLSEDEAKALFASWEYTARPEQLPPDGEWFVWLVLAGRGFGKTRCSTEWVVQRVIDGKAKRIALVGRTAADVRDVLIEGQSGIVSVAQRRGVEAIYEPSKRRITFPQHGAVATSYSAEEGKQLRGPEHDTAIADELASWPIGKGDDDTWSNLLMGLRLGDPKVVAPTTPRPTKLIKELVKDPKTAVTRGSTFDNAANLATTFLDEVKRKFAGTRRGRQELEGQILEDVEGALWKLEQIELTRLDEAPPLKRVVVAIDPAVSTGEQSDFTAITVAGQGFDDRFNVLHAEQLKVSPNAWATRALDLFDQFKADRIIAERNNGGDMVEHTIRTVRRSAPVKTIHASRGKQTRAEPIAALYEQGRVSHVGTFVDLEDQMITFPVAAEHDDLVDALVYALTELDPSSAQAPGQLIPMRRKR